MLICSSIDYVYPIYVFWAMMMLLCMKYRFLEDAI
uniref:Uncharacterized protein n=1 Tax=Rhizophora mucronata TaxID=61149 RepID=A0A2P2NS73_RHIMU